MNNRILKFKFLILPLLILKTIIYDVQAATSTDVKITSYVREPVCSIDVPTEIDLGSAYIPSRNDEFKKRVNFKIKIECQEATNIPTWLTADAEVDVDPYVTTIKGTDESLRIYIDGFKGIDFNGVVEFCKGDVDRECELSVYTASNNDVPGQGEAKVTFNLNVN
ncbi:MAG: hypothetical protein KH020_12145 [Clostridiales bacterium]|nr:hypothetical protein [Clostridiales bacterium]